MLVCSINAFSWRSRLTMPSVDGPGPGSGLFSDSPRAGEQRDGQRRRVYLTLSQLGPAALAGFALFLLMAPISSVIASHQFKIRGWSMRFTDKRSKTLLEVLGMLFQTSWPGTYSAGSNRWHARSKIFLFRNPVSAK